MTQNQIITTIQNIQTNRSKLGQHKNQNQNQHQHQNTNTLSVSTPVFHPAILSKNKDNYGVDPFAARFDRIFNIDTQKIIPDEERTIRRARINILKKYQFFASVAMMPILLDKGITDTIATNGKAIYYNPDFMSKQSYEETYFIVLHEILHCVLMHTYRRNKRNHRLYNIAADYVVNDYIIRTLGLIPPKDALIDVAFANMNTEMVYEKLKEQQDSDSLSIEASIAMDSNSKIPGEVLDIPDESKKHERFNQNIIQSALDTAQKNGMGQKGDLSEIENLLRIMDCKKKVKRIAWYHLLQNTVQHTIASDYGFKQPNVRYVASGFYLPSFSVKTIQKLSLVIDVSGSILSRPEMLNDFFEHIRNIAEDCSVLNIDVITCDTMIREIFTVSSYELMFHKFNITGGGGTDFNPPFKYYEDSYEQPDVMIYFTDLDGYFPKEEPAYPVIWCVIKDNYDQSYQPKSPWGIEITYDP